MKKAFIVLVVTSFAILSMYANNANQDKQVTENIISMFSESANVINGKCEVIIPSGWNLVGTMPNASSWFPDSGKVTITLPFWMMIDQTSSIDLLLENGSGDKRIVTVNLTYS